MPSCLKSNQCVEYDAFRHFKRVYFLGDPEPNKRLIVVFSTMGDFTFYGDESYGKADAYAVAGYVASVEQWEAFINAWEVFKREEGFNVLHKADLEHCARRTEFEWPDLTTDERVAKKLRINKRACDLILQHVAAGIGVVVQKSTWRSVIAESRWAEAYGKSFYAAGVLGCLQLASYWFEKKRKLGMIRYVFEEGADGRHEAEKMLRRLKGKRDTRDRFRIAGYSFESKEDPEFVPLQAADFLAYEGYRQIDNLYVEGVKLDSRGRRLGMRGAMRCLMRSDEPEFDDFEPDDLPTPHYVRWLDDKAIRQMLRRAETRFPDGPTFL
jgi:hypothetical protein